MAEETEFDRRKFRHEQRKLCVEGLRFKKKEWNDNRRAALKEAHEDYRRTLGAIYKTLIAYSAISITLIGSYATASSSTVEVIKMHAHSLLVLGLYSWFIAIYAQWIAVKSFRFSFEYGIKPVRDDLDLRRTATGLGKDTRQIIEWHTRALLVVIYMVYLTVWTSLLEIKFSNVMSMLAHYLKP